jgi:GT2 family glycosyltransferase
LIAFLDADDLWVADKLECQFNALRENPEAALAYSWTDYIDESAQFSHPGDRVTASGNVYEQLLLRNFLDNGSNALVRKSALLRVGGFDESLSYGEDWELWLRLAALYPFVAVPRPQVLYRMSASAASADTSQMEARSLKVIERVFDRVPESLQHLKKYRLSNFYQYLTFRTLEKPLLRQKGVTAARYLWLALKQDPSLLKRRAPLIVKVSLKIAAIVLFSTPPTLAWLDKLRPPIGKKAVGGRSASDR